MPRSAVRKGCRVDGQRDLPFDLPFRDAARDALAASWVRNVWQLPYVFDLRLVEGHIIVHIHAGIERITVIENIADPESHS